MVSSPEGSGTRLPRPVTSRAGLAGWSGAVSGMGVRVGGRQGGCIVRLHIVPRAGVGSSANLAALLPPAGEGGAKRRMRGSTIGRAHVCTTVTIAHLVCRLLLEKKKKNNN